MSTVTDNDLKELKDFLNAKFEQINDKIDNRYQLLDSKFNDMRVEIATVKTEVTGINKRLDENINAINKRLEENNNAINKRLDNLDFIARSVAIGIIVALLGGLAKMLYPNLFG